MVTIHLQYTYKISISAALGFGFDYRALNFMTVLLVSGTNLLISHGREPDDQAP